ncbi:MAG TPA: hypothetical protein VFH56_05505, partial [Acidimicrobiales bacterium]|nr:hypothetical protein [Acidimicrobiales bacterium]
LCVLLDGSRGGVPVNAARCHCGRPVPESSECGCCCGRHDDPAVRTPAPDPSPAEQAVIDRFGIFDEEAS